jgi:hypothetical protein
MHLLYFRKGDLEDEYVVFTDEAKKEWKDLFGTDGFVLTAVFNMDSGNWEKGNKYTLPTEDLLVKEI